jgi:hypothetical protein
MFLAVGLAFFAAAILLHHNLNLASMARDVVIYPVALLGAAAIWKKRPWLYIAAGIVVAIPSLAFLDNVSVLTQPEKVKPFLNQLFLLAAGVGAILGGISAFKKRT